MVSGSNYHVEEDLVVWTMFCKWQLSCNFLCCKNVNYLMSTLRQPVSSLDSSENQGIIPYIEPWYHALHDSQPLLLGLPLGPRRINGTNLAWQPFSAPQAALLNPCFLFFLPSLSPGTLRAEFDELKSGVILPKTLLRLSAHLVHPSLWEFFSSVKGEVGKADAVLSELLLFPAYMLWNF